MFSKHTREYLIFLQGWIYPLGNNFVPKKLRNGAMVGWSSWLECPAIYQKKVAVSIPGHGIYLGCRFDPWSGAYRRQLLDVSFSPSLSKINKHILL